jgi:hypothetical protein
MTGHLRARKSRNWLPMLPWSRVLSSLSDVPAACCWCTWQQMLTCQRRCPLLRFRTAPCLSLLCSALLCSAPRAPRRTKRASRFDFGSRSRCRGESSGIYSTGRSAGGGCDAADLGGAADAAGVAIQWWVVLRVGRAACSMIQLIVSIPTTARALHVSNTLVEFDNYKLGSEASVEILAVRVNWINYDKASKWSSSVQMHANIFTSEGAEGGCGRNFVGHVHIKGVSDSEREWCNC